MTETEDVVVQPLESVMVTVYVPGTSLVIVAEVLSLLHFIVRGAVPPLELTTVAVPSASPLQVTFVFDTVTCSMEGFPTTTVSVLEQPPLPVMTTV